VILAVIFRYQHRDQVYTIQVESLGADQYRVKVDDREYQVQGTAWNEQLWRLIVDGQNHIAHTAADGQRRWVQLDGQAPVMLEVAKSETSRRGRSSAGEARLNAQMPGQVVDVVVAVGDAVTDGQTLMMLEAMKMEIRVSAPYAGIVQQVHVAKGDVVERDQLLIEIKAQTVDGDVS
jgi:biotin carboxyl carrier protein